MIDTDKYEGHTEGPWANEYDEELGEHTIESHDGMIAQRVLGVDADLIADAPLLLAEVKRLREQPKVTIDDWDKKGPCVTVYLEGCEYVGTLRLYKDENGKVIE